MEKKKALKPIAKQTLNKVIVKRLTEFILNELDDGDKMPSEKELMEELHVGRSSLREALRAVETIGLIEVRAGSGSYVTKDTGNIFRKPIELGLFSTDQTMEELIEARACFEIGIVDLVVDNITDEELNEIEAILQEMKASSADIGKLLSADFKLHNILYQSTRNSILSHFSDLVSQIIGEVRGDYFRKPNDFAESFNFHQDILEALKKRDKKKTMEATVAHNAWVRKVFLKSDK